MVKAMTQQELISRTCSIQGQVMAIIRMNARILAVMSDRDFEEVLAEAIEEASGITKELYESLPTSK